jgi:hypothetical protein
MKARVFLSLAACLLFAGLAAAQTNTGTIKGRITLAGKPPGNPVIRMGRDPMCAKANTGKLVVQETVLTQNGGLANVFVRLQGNFPQTPVPSQPVTIDQRGCIYIPRVVGVRVGQTLQIKNDDNWLHNLHGASTRNMNFNVGQPRVGLVYEYKPTQEEIMIKLGCDVHSWMNAYVGVVTNPYFTVSGTGGTFEIDKVPPGTHTVQIWHERFGMLTKSVTVKAGAVTMADFSYAGTEKP